MAKASNPLHKFKKVLDNKYAFTMDEEDNPYKVHEYVGSGCYVLNAALSDGDIWKGIPLGKRIGIAGPSGVAKSLFTLYLVKNFLIRKENSYAFVFESEGSSLLEQSERLGIPKDRVLTIPVNTIEDFMIQSSRIMEQIKAEREAAGKDKSGCPTYIMVLDSLGQLQPQKLHDDALKGEIKADVGLTAKLVRQAFRKITLDLSLTQTPMIVVNHSYACMEEGTKVKTSNGVLPIEFIKVGDFVETMEGPKEVEKTVDYEIDTHAEICLEDGTIYRTTPNHCFLVKNGDESIWKEAREITSGDEIISI